MKKYDDIVVGSGISGLTLALLLGMAGHKVLLLEKNSYIGGGLIRFYKQGIPFDTGFHFTGGFCRDGLLCDMLTVLGIGDYIQPIFLSQEKANRFIFESGEAVYNIPAGRQNLIIKLKEYFPQEERAIEKYFEMVCNVCSQTVLMDLRKISVSSPSIDEDFISLDTVLNQLTDNCLLKALLSGYCMCYGVKPMEVSFANHSRVCCGLYESVARVKGGGESFIRAFKKKFENFDIDVMCGRYITNCLDVCNDCIGRFVLNTGEEIAGIRCTFAIHPKETLKILPKEYLSKAFIDRVSGFESSAGFFSVFGVFETDNSTDDFGPTIDSLFPAADINKLLDPYYTGVPALVVMNNREEVNGISYQAVNAFELSFPEHVEKWKESKAGSRPLDYSEYKQKRIDSITERIIKTYPERKNSFRVVDSASVLTFRDYLNSPDGSAYGVKQKMGQYNLFGKLPLRNIYAVGQSSVLPGLVGAMISSFIVGRSIVGKEKYNCFIQQRLCS